MPGSKRPIKPSFDFGCYALRYAIFYAGFLALTLTCFYVLTSILTFTFIQAIRFD
jgi:hypothetical protein